MQGSTAQEAQDELMNLMTVMYMMIQHAIVYPEDLDGLRKQLGTSISFFFFFWCTDQQLTTCQWS